jgi:3-isopropylmalate/(R)-2-methylmalate dehydratase small subunit
MEKFVFVEGIAAPMMADNITTDAMSPTAAGKSSATDLGHMLFANSRYLADSSENPDFILNRPPFRNSVFLVAGENFGCGSSRERAVWALMRFGIRCVVAPSFAEIFRDNAYQNGLLPLTLPAADCSALGASLAHTENPTMVVDLARCTLRGPDGRIFHFEIPAERQTALMEGLDEISFILTMMDNIDAYQRRERSARPWVFPQGAARGA